VLVYHTGDEKGVVGVAEATSEAIPTPSRRTRMLAVVDLRAVGRCRAGAALAEIKKTGRSPTSGSCAWAAFQSCPCRPNNTSVLKLGGMK